MCSTWLALNRQRIECDPLLSIYPACIHSTALSLQWHRMLHGAVCSVCVLVCYNVRSHFSDIYTLSHAVAIISILTAVNELQTFNIWPWIFHSFVSLFAACIRTALLPIHDQHTVFKFGAPTIRMKNSSVKTHHLNILIKFIKYTQFLFWMFFSLVWNWLKSTNHLIQRIIIENFLVQIKTKLFIF